MGLEIITLGEAEKYGFPRSMDVREGSAAFTRGIIYDHHFVRGDKSLVSPHAELIYTPQKNSYVMSGAPEDIAKNPYVIEDFRWVLFGSIDQYNRFFEEMNKEVLSGKLSVGNYLALFNSINNIYRGFSINPAFRLNMRLRPDFFMREFQRQMSSEPGAPWARDYLLRAKLSSL